MLEVHAEFEDTLYEENRMKKLSKTQARRNFLVKAGAGAVGLSALALSPSVAHASTAETQTTMASTPVLTASFTLQSTANGFLSGYISVPGPQSANDITIMALARVNPNLGVDSAFPALFHVRQADFAAGIPLPIGPLGYSDQFSVQLVRYAYPVENNDTLALVLRLRRVDQNIGWGQSLRIDTLLKLKG